MFVGSDIEKERIQSILNYAKNSNYSRNKLTACYPYWWDNTDVSSEREAEFALMCQHFLDPSSQQLSSVYKEMKTKIQVVRFNGAQDGKGGITTNWWDRCQWILFGMPV